jgi:predicted negative regulator of RcsB-dependent stress response
MPTDPTIDQEKSPRETILKLLRSRNQKARFISEVYAALARAHVERDEADAALRQLEADGAVMIRDHCCGDPHLAGVDLRVAALVHARGESDPQMSTIRVIDEEWNKWLSEYLANHRCG